MHNVMPVQLSATRWTVVRLLCPWDFPPPGDLPDPGLEPPSPALAGGFFTTMPPGKLAQYNGYRQ